LIGSAKNGKERYSIYYPGKSRMLSWEKPKRRLKKPRSRNKSSTKRREKKVGNKQYSEHVFFRILPENAARQR